MTQIVQYHCDRCGQIEDRKDTVWCWLRYSPGGKPLGQGAGGTSRVELCPPCEKLFLAFMDNGEAA